MLGQCRGRVSVAGAFAWNHFSLRRASGETGTSFAPQRLVLPVVPEIQELLLKHSTCFQFAASGAWHHFRCLRIQTFLVTALEADQILTLGELLLPDLLVVVMLRSSMIS